MPLTTVRLGTMAKVDSCTIVVQYFRSINVDIYCGCAQSSVFSLALQLCVCDVSIRR